jgi:tetratricopeptide (TPR) repeat protein
MRLDAALSDSSPHSSSDPPPATLSSLAPPCPPPCAKEFIETLQPSLKQGKLDEALHRVQSRWTASQIVSLLSDKSSEVRKVAAFALSMIGDRSAVQPLAVILHDADAAVVQMAEHALWSVWFRLANPRAVSLVKCGNTQLHHGNYLCAIEKFTQALHEDPQFAEAHNQRAIAYYLSERFAESIEDCKAALALMPQHFGAMSGMGHCHAHLGQWRQARHCYRLALAIHPRLEGIQSSLQQIDALLRENAAL